MINNLLFEVNEFIKADPSLLADKHQPFKMLIGVNAFLQIIAGSGHFIVNQAVRPKATLETQALEPLESNQLLNVRYARYCSEEESELTLTTNPVWLTSLSKFGI